MTGEQLRDVPIFDADQHMYETPDALTRYLPARYRDAVQYAHVRRGYGRAQDLRLHG